MTRESFAINIRYCVGCDDKVFCWLNTWVGDRRLADESLDLFSCTQDHQVKVSTSLDRYGRKLQFDFYSTHLFRTIKLHVFIGLLFFLVLATHQLEWMMRTRKGQFQIYGVPSPNCYFRDKFYIYLCSMCFWLF